MISIEEFANHLELAAKSVRPRLEIALAKIGTSTQTVAAEYIGREMPEWAPLSEATLNGFRHPSGFWIPGKIELGFVGHVSATDPLLRTGANQESIGIEIEGLELIVGSPRKEFLWMEMGTKYAPPRPSIALAMQHGIEYSADVLGETAVKLLTGAKP